MANYVLVPGAGGSAWYWHLVTPRLRSRGHNVTAVDLPATDDSAGLATYVDLIHATVDGRSPVILVAQSMGALSASVVCAKTHVDLLVLVAPMIPAPGESGGAWWENTGQAQAAGRYAREEGRDPDVFDEVEIFLHDLAPDVKEAAMAQPPGQSSTPFADPWPLQEWPAVETRVVAGRYDRLFPLDFVTRLSRERLGVVPDVVDSGHLVALSQPGQLVERLERYREELGIN